MGSSRSHSRSSCSPTTSRLHLGALRGDAGLPVRLLLIGLPLMIGLGMLVGIVLFPDLDLWVVALIAAAVAPTDAALGAEVVEDRRVPARVRRALNVESGLNDGIATPIVTFCIAGTVAEASSSDITVASALRELGIGAVGGIAVGGIGGLLLVYARRRAWAAPSFVPIGILALAIGAYAGSIEADGNGFVAAFVAGMAFGAVART